MNSASDQRLFCPLYLEGGRGGGGGGLMMFTVTEVAKGQLSSGAGSLVNSSISLGGNFHRLAYRTSGFLDCVTIVFPTAVLCIVRQYLQYTKRTGSPQLF